MQLKSRANYPRKRKMVGDSTRDGLQTPKKPVVSFSYSSRMPTREEHTKAKKSLLLLTERMRVSGMLEARIRSARMNMGTSNNNMKRNRGRKSQERTADKFNKTQTEIKKPRNQKRSVRKETDERVYGSAKQYSRNDQFNDMLRNEFGGEEDQYDDRYSQPQQTPTKRQQPNRRDDKRSRTPRNKPRPSMTMNQPIDMNNFEDIPLAQQKGQFQLDEEEDADVKVYKCPEGCGRSFKKEALQKHRTICKKVFQKKRKQFDVTKQRMNEDQLQMEVSGKAKKTKKPVKKKKTKIPQWKLQSSQLRQAIMAARGQDTSNTEEAKMLQANLEAQMTKCEFCGRTFNEKAAARHIVHCKKKAMEKKFKEKEKANEKKKATRKKRK